jgi:mRNA-degrading endonuclease RelE of RelBE toxin-antitoxin system
MWQIRYHPAATAGIYTIPRGPAALVTAAIRSLIKNPTSGEVVEGKVNMYRIRPAGYTVEYEVRATQEPQVIVILNIE